MTKKKTTPENRLKLVAIPKEGFSSYQFIKRRLLCWKRIDTLKGRMTTTLVAKDLPKPRETKLPNAENITLPQVIH